MNFSDYRARDALGLAQLVNRGEATAEELRQCAETRTDAVEPRVNAITHRLMPDGAGAARFAFAGVPFLVKDYGQSVPGAPDTRGSRAFADERAQVEATYTARARAAGLQILGRTNTPELALKAVTENQLHGATRNPWDLSRTPGGSSGGAAAAVAAGIVPMAGASDGGGSIRIPAAYCGLFGLRPSRGRVPEGPHADEIWEGASSAHVISRSVRDSAVMLDCLRGADAGARIAAPPPLRPYAEALTQPPGRLRVALNTRSPIGGPVNPECRAAAESTARLLEELGHEVVEAVPPVDGQAVAHRYLMLYFAQTAAAVQERPRGPFEFDTRMLAALGKAVSAGEYVAARADWNRFARAMAGFFEQFDLYLTPTTAEPPAAIGATDTPLLERLAATPVLKLRGARLLLKAGVVEQIAFRSLRRTPFTQLANLTGAPAMSVPLHWGGDGLPYGSHFHAPFCREDLLFQLAAQLEAARPWFSRVPPLE